eukprot:3990403-Lingulodinium_polyedra.AAC.1
MAGKTVGFAHPSFVCGKHSAVILTVAAGFMPIEAWPSCFWHEELRLMLSVYVDDFKMAGPTAN